MIRARIVSQGEELVTGQRTDTNATRVAELLTDRGVRVRGGVTACDEVGELVEAYRLAARGVEFVVSTGGLGPTTDDLTAEAVAEAFGLPLVHHPGAMAQVEAAFVRIGRPMPAVNAKQALLPSPCEVVPNPTGTAPGFIVEAGGTPVICLPGVPSEMEPMMADTVLPWLERRFALRPALRRTFRAIGPGESQLQERLDDLIRDVEPRGARVGFRAMIPEVHVKLVVPAERDGAEEVFEAAARGIADRLGMDCFATDGVTLPAALGALLVARGATLAVAESCTGGMIAQLATSVPGSSDWFGYGYVTYADQAKIDLLGVPPELIREHGAVSEAVCLAMAEGARARSGATYAVSVTGIAGPGGGTPDKPVGTVWVGYAGPEGASARLLRFGRDREANRRFSACAALERLRRHLVRADEGTLFAGRRRGPRVPLTENEQI